MTCDMCLGEVRDTAQADSLALLPTTTRGRGGAGWEGLLSEQSDLSSEGVRKCVVGGLGLHTLSPASKDQGPFSQSL